MAKKNIREWVGPRCSMPGIRKSMSEIMEATSSKGIFMLTFRSLEVPFPRIYPKARCPTANVCHSSLCQLHAPLTLHRVEIKRFAESAQFARACNSRWFEDKNGCVVWFQVSGICSSSIGFGGGVVAIVHPIQAPIPRMAMKPMKTGIATIHMRMASRAGHKRASEYAIAMATQTVQITTPMA